MNILVTNDDGYTEGMKALLEVAGKMGNAYALVPDRQRSAISSALTLHKALRLNKLDKNVHEFNGTPADAVVFATYSKEFDTPDLVLSGVNFGDNTGLSSIISSGTIGACWQAAIENIPSISFSKHNTNNNWRDKSAWGDLKQLKKHIGLVIKKLENDLNSDVFYNVNMPDDLSAPKILMTNNMQRQRFKTTVTKRFDPSSKAYFWITGTQPTVEAGTDFHEVTRNKNITITAVPLQMFKAVEVEEK